MEKKVKKRIFYIDELRAIAILAVILCHSTTFYKPYVYDNIKSAKSLTEGDPMRRKTILTEEQAAQEQSTFFHKKAQKDIRWDKLDNTAHLFPVIAGERMSNTYRISVTLTEMVDPELLQQALEALLQQAITLKTSIQISRLAQVRLYSALLS